MNVLRITKNTVERTKIENVTIIDYNKLRKDIEDLELKLSDLKNYYLELYKSSICDEDRDSFFTVEAKIDILEDVIYSLNKILKENK